MFYKPSLYTIESVTNGHPDKLCDQISDAILDACLAEDPHSRVAVETFGNHGRIHIGGEVTTRAKVSYEDVARSVYEETGYANPVTIDAHINEQSPNIAQGVDVGGAGDQGIMYGYATNETKEYLPRGVVFAHALTKGLQILRESGEAPWLRPDGKGQVTLRGGNVETILVSCQHDENVSQEEIKNELEEKLICPIFGKHNAQIFINPTGLFTIGGFDADTGLTGRKLMVDTYGGFVPHGGGCFSGKDPSKVDRSAAYMARYVAKNLVANGYAKDCLVSVAYAIGRKEPLMIEATNERGESLRNNVLKNFSFEPKTIIETLDLRRPIYTQTASYGHFGNPAYPWEKIIEI